MQPQPLKIALLALAFAAFAVPGAQAQDAGSAITPSSGLAAPGAGPADVGLQVYGGPKPGADQGLAIAGWLLYPSIFLGYNFNDNVYATKNYRVAASGVRLSPSLQGGLDNGLWRTNISFAASAIYYPGLGGQTRNSYGTGTSVQDAGPSNVTGHASVSETWLPLADWSVMATGNFIRSQGLYGPSSATNGFGLSTPGVTASAFTPSYIPSMGTISAQQQYTNMYGGQLSVQKTINERTSLSGSIFAQGVSYDSTPSITQLVSGVPTSVSSSSSPGGMSYGASMRGSFYATPQVYVFVQPTYSLQHYNVSYDNANGYSAKVGLGSNLIGFFSGEIYGGWQVQSSVYGYFPTRSAPSFGAHISYAPTPLLTLTLRFSQVLGAAQSIGAGSVPMSPTANANTSLTQQVYLSANYGLNSYTSLNLHAGWGQTRYNGASSYSSYTGQSFAASSAAGLAYASSGYSNQIWSLGGGLSYNFWRNSTINLAYTFQDNSGGNPSAFLLSSPNLRLGYTQNVFSAGIRYSY